MVDNSTSHGVTNFLIRRHSTGDGSLPNLVLPSYPTSTPYDCQEFNAPEGNYSLAHSIFIPSLQPLYSVGSSASLVSIKYKENNNLQRYEAQPGARNFRRMFMNDSDEESAFPPTIPEDESSSSPKLSFLSRNSYKKKPRTSITKTNSSFVQKIVTNDQLAKILMSRTSDDTHLFYNCGTSFVWMDASGHPKEPLSRTVFTRACPTSHDVNLLTRAADQLDLIIGFTSGDIIWFDPLCNKYGRINKGGIMNSSLITMIKWLPGHENLFMASFQDGSIMLFDKDKEDEVFHPDLIQQEKHTFKISKHAPKIALKCNPVSHWKLSLKSVTAFAFSPDCQHVAIVSLDGLLRIVNILHETMSDIYESYYGGLFCVSWSPDGRYILTGGQDDLVTIWAFKEQRIIARCQGHHSWVTSVAFDPWRCDEKLYRFASVGEDAKLILWDFSVNALHKPKRNRSTSVSSMTSPPLSSILSTMEEKGPNIHPVLSKTRVAFLQPTVIKTVHGDPCTGVYFREDAIITSDKRGKINIWQRP